MALSPQEQQIIEYAKQNGKTAAETKAAVAKFRLQQTSPATPSASEQTERPGLLSRAADKVTNFLGLDGATDVFGRAIARTEAGAKATGGDVEANRQYVEAPTRKQLAGAAVQTAATALSPAIPVPAGLAAKVLAGASAGYAYDIGQDLVDERSTGDTLLPGGAAVVGSIIPGAGPIGKKGAEAAGRAVSAAGRQVTQSPVVKGAMQNAVEFSERIPRFVSRRNIDLRDAATRSERIANSPAPIGNALKVGVDERIINTVEQADAPTRRGYGEIIRLAEESNATDGTIKIKARPEIVAGEAAAEQYKLIDEQRRNIGQQIGDQVKNLSRDRVVGMQPAYSTLNEALEEIGVKVVQGESGPVSLNFGRTGFTKAQRAKINELYELATEGGEALTPAEIHAKDRLFSQLQRETRMEGIGDILVDTPSGQMSLFRVFRDVYSDTLEGAAPEIRPLNGQYRNLVTFTDDIEKTIIKSGKYETTSNVDPAEFAQTNLRRLFSEAQSAADYRAIAEEMDAASRALGYQGATPSDLAQFAYEIRKIYPDTVPRTGFEGSIRSVGDMLMSATKAGAPDTVDQQKALREIIEYYESVPSAGG